jgi:hypothetical protein
MCLFRILYSHEYREEGFLLLIPLFARPEYAKVQLGCKERLCNLHMSITLQNAIDYSVKMRG